MGRSILICDDEPHVTQLLALNLEEAGFVVRDAPNGLRALELAEAERPDLVITDFQMPLMNGLELARRLRDLEATSDVPVLMLTSRSHRVSEEHLAATSIVRLLPKPFSPREVAGEVIRLLSGPEPLGVPVPGTTGLTAPGRGHRGGSAAEAA